MNILLMYIRKYLLKNKKRTALSIFSIFLATALLFSVSSLVHSTGVAANKTISQSTGNYHVSFSDVSDKFMGYLDHNLLIDHLIKVENIGVSPIETLYNQTKPYIKLLGFNQAAFENLNVTLLEGRFPEKEQEVVISEAMLNEARVGIKIGDTIQLAVGNRVSEDNHIINLYADYQSKERFEPVDESIYQVVGIMAPMIRDAKSSSYSMLTYYNEYSWHEIDAYLHFKNVADTTKNTESLVQLFEGEYTTYSYNERLLTYTNFLDAQFISLDILVYLGFALVIFLLITILLIRNSFANTYRNREKQLAILKSVGVTNHQRSYMVFYEGLIILGIGLPLGLLGGWAFIEFAFSSLNELLLSTSITAIQLEKVNLVLFGFCSALFVLVVAYLSLLWAADKAGKKTISSTLRSTEEVEEVNQPYLNLESKQDILGQLTKKHIKQNKSAYRSILLTFGCVLFLLIQLSGTIAYLREGGILDLNEHNYDVVVNIKNRTYPTRLMTRLKQLPTASNVLLVQKLRVTSQDLEALDEAYRGYYTQEESVVFELVAYNDEVLRNYCLRNNILNVHELDQLFNTEKLHGILIDQRYNSVEGKFYSVLQEDAIKDLYYEDVLLSESMHLTKSDILISGLSYRDVPSILISTSALNAMIEKIPVSLLENYSVYYQSSNVNQLVRECNQLVESEAVVDYEVVNAQATLAEGKSMILLIQILIYGYIVIIAIMSIFAAFCEVSTNFEYRIQEFVLYRLMGLKLMDMRKIMFVEYFYYCFICLGWSIVLSQIANWWMYNAIFKVVGLKLYIPKITIFFCIIASIAAGCILIPIMVSRIKKNQYGQVSKNEISML